MITAELIRRGARRFPERTALIVGDERWSFAAVNAWSNRLAHALAGQGLGRGAPVGLLVNNGRHCLPLDFACVKSGINRVPLNARLSLDEHARMLGDTGCRALVYGADLAERAADLGALLPGLQLYGLGSVAGGGRDLDDDAAAASDAEPAVRLGPDDVVITLFTSGTTGRLKAAQHTQASYAAIVANIFANLPTLVGPHGDGAGEAMLHSASLIHASGTFVLPFWLRGAAAVVLPRFDPGEIVAAIARERVTATNLVPTMLAMLLEHPALETADLSSLRTIVYGASPMPRPLIERALERLGPRFVQYYGQTEAPLCITTLAAADHVGPGADARLGSAGLPAVDMEVRLVDEAGNDVTSGDIGEVAVRGPSVMRGYFAAPDLDAATRLPGGWLRTRDLGRFDERGYLHLVDRQSDMIITGGYNVYPREVEDALGLHPAVLECAVVAAPDDTWVEAVTAFVVLRPGMQASEAELMATVRARLAAYKAPRAVRFVASLPRSPVGKVLRRALRDPLWTGRLRSP